MGKFKYIVILVACLLSTSALADNNANCTNSQDCYNSGVYIYEDGQDLIDLQTNYISTSYNLNACDDCWGGTVALGMEWERWGQTWGHAGMSTNGCLGFMGGSSGSIVNASSCTDYTPQALPYRDYTLYPFWTDLIRKNNTSAMLFKDFGDHVVFGWYKMKEFNRSSSNSFEVILYENNSFEYRYRELDITQHDVVIGEQGHHSSTPADTKTYLYYNDGQSGYDTLDEYLANSGWPDLENGGSLFGGTEAQMCEISALYASTCSGYAAAYLAQQCAIDTLYNSACTGYAAAYLTQQCDLNTLYSESCTGYAAAYLTYQCSQNTLYSESCTGYAVALFLYECDIDVFYATSCSGYASALAQEEALWEAIYGTDDESYGYDDGYNEYGYDEYGDAYTQDDMWYDEEYDEYLDPNDPCYENACENFTDADWYALDTEQFGQEQVDEWYGSEVEFSEEGYIDYGSQSEEEYWTEIDEGMIAYDAEQDAIWAAEELAWQEEEQRYLEEEQARIAEEEMYALEEEAYWAEEEAFYATMETDADLYEYEVEEFGQEQVDEWWGAEVEFSEEGFVAEEYWEEAVFEEELYTQNETYEDIYILEEEVGIEILVEQEWSTDEELDIYEEVLEDYERDLLEEQEEEIFEEFEETYEDIEEEFLEIEDEAFEELINEEELEELFFEDNTEEELFEEHEDDAEDEEERPNSPSSPTKTLNPSRDKSDKRSVTSVKVMIAAQEQQEQQTIQQAVSQQDSPSQAVISEIDFGGSAEVSQTIAEVVSEQLDDGSSSSFSSSGSGSGSSSGSTMGSGSVSYGSGGSSGGQSFASSSSSQEMAIQATGDTYVAEQVEQSTGQSQIDVAQVVDSGPVISAFEVAEQQAEDTSAQVELTFDDGSSFGTASVQFETSFDDALGAGQSIGQFLSNTAPSFAKFEVAPQTQSEQRTTSAVESLAERVGSAQTEANLQAQFEQISESGGFESDQTATVAYLGYSAGFSQYTDQTQIADNDDWYRTKTMYKDKKIDDNKFGFYMMAGKTQGKLQEMIRSQYNK